MFSRFKTHPVHIKIYKNRLVICSPETKVCIKKTGNFSNPRLAIADFELAEKLMREAFIELFPNSGIFSSAPIVAAVVQQFELTEGGISPVERRAMIDSCEHAGAKEVKIIESDKALSYEEVMDVYKN